ncbi:TPA: hypothetical protein N0F65_000391 [Lagenidium giganteum]|uniref:Uncharacterized protein n=1 Tax=Lagenidium giganteum TaxID=4803 RepID=A0AAV2Z399_9STRA|nr:TPA: hypothetical protein N0F65_000391 [Lagenidium giganteum]
MKRISMQVRDVEAVEKTSETRRQSIRKEDDRREVRKVLETLVQARERRNVCTADTAVAGPKANDSSTESKHEFAAEWLRVRQHVHEVAHDRDRAGDDVDVLERNAVRQPAEEERRDEAADTEQRGEQAHEHHVAAQQLGIREQRRQHDTARRLGRQLDRNDEQHVHVPGTLSMSAVRHSDRHCRLLEGGFLDGSVIRDALSDARSDHKRSLLAQAALVLARTTVLLFHVDGHD